MSADLLRRLIEAGTPAELIAEVAMLAGEVSALEKRRAADRARQQAHRERASRDITLCHVPSRDVTAKKKSPPDPQKEKPTPLNGSPKGEPIPPTPSLRPEHVIEAYTDVAERCGLPAIRKMTGTREKQLRIFVRRNSIDEVKAALDAIERSAFLRGENDRGWRADFDFLLQPKSFAKLIEGAYDH